MAYVGPIDQYDFMGATQFRLLCTLGLRSNHNLLDFGCGCLRAGRFLINYLEKGRYHGVEPNEWLVDMAFKTQLGQDLKEIKSPKFDYSDDFSVNFDATFDYIVAQSIFSHADACMIDKALKSFKASLKDSGLIAVTFVEGATDFEDKGWVYPDVVTYSKSRINKFSLDAGLYIKRIPWYHPRQTWYLLAKKREMIPSNRLLHYLSGSVLFQEEFSLSVRSHNRIYRLVRKLLGKDSL